MWCAYYRADISLMNYRQDEFPLTRRDAEIISTLFGGLRFATVSTGLTDAERLVPL